MLGPRLIPRVCIRSRKVRLVTRIGPSRAWSFPYLDFHFAPQRIFSLEFWSSGRRQSQRRLCVVALVLFVRGRRFRFFLPLPYLIFSCPPPFSSLAFAAPTPWRTHASHRLFRSVDSCRMLPQV